MFHAREDEFPILRAFLKSAKYARVSNAVITRTHPADHSLPPAQLFQRMKALGKIIRVTTEKKPSSISNWPSALLMPLWADQ
jgi:hypothetical protein